jgi:excisionase family DNA binding protein
MQENIDCTVDTGDMLTIREASEVLNVSRSLVYDLVKHKKIQHYRIGGAIRIHRDDLMIYLNNSIIWADSLT